MVVRAESLKKLRTMLELQSRKEVLEIKGKHLIKESEVLTSAADEGPSHANGNGHEAG